MIAPVQRDKLFRFSLVLLITHCLADPTPQVVPWSKNKTYGPDGPWQAVSISVGEDKAGRPLNNVDLFPGGFAYHLIFGKDYCSDKSGPCAASAAGLYDYENSATVNRDVTHNPGLVWTQGADLARKMTGNASIMLDTIRINTTAAGSNKQDGVTVPDSALDAIHDESIILPDGSAYSPQIGSLALGSVAGTRHYDNGTGQIIPNYLATKNITPSASTSLHYGSALHGPEGSLIFGGYDSNRVISPVGKFQIATTDSLLNANLVDITLGVQIGGSPFPSQQPEISGLLALNKTFGAYQPTVINPTLPYFFMSPETCDNIAKNLPITLQRSSGLYTWNTDDPQYQRVVSSPTYLAFTFRSGASDKESSPATNLTLKIPFKLLDLTLSPPLVETPTQYFPCYPFSAGDGSGRYFLGRAFLQSTFLAMNFNSSEFFLAQAPGPDVGAGEIKSILLDDETIASGPEDDFAKSWEKQWTPLPPHSPITSGTQQRGSNKLPGGAIAGIVIGVIVALLMVALATFLLRLRKHRAQAEVAEKAVSDYDSSDPNSFAQSRPGWHEKDAGLGGGGWHEKDAHPVFEADAENAVPPELSPMHKKASVELQGAAVERGMGQGKMLPELPTGAASPAPLPIMKNKEESEDLVVHRIPS